jgi:hypothetical protein
MELRGRGRATEKKNYKKDLRISVNRAIMDSNKTSRHKRQRRKKEPCKLCLTRRKLNPGSKKLTKTHPSVWSRLHYRRLRHASG